MKKNIPLCLLMALLVASLSVSADTYKCENSDFRIEAEANGYNDHIDLDENPEEVLQELFDNKSTVKVTDLNTDKTYTYDLVAVIADGAGQTSFQAFKINKDSLLTPLEMKTDFYYEHEGGCLDGRIYSEKEEKWVSWDNCWGNSDNRMMCRYQLD